MPKPRGRPRGLDGDAAEDEAMPEQEATAPPATADTADDGEQQQPAGGLQLLRFWTRGKRPGRPSKRPRRSRHADCTAAKQQPDQPAARATAGCWQTRLRKVAALVGVGRSGVASSTAAVDAATPTPAAT